MIAAPITTAGGSGGAYTAERAAALSGVPKSTIHYWARNGILLPSVSRERVKLWSYSDLLGLRTIYWLRQPKTLGDGRSIPSTTMGKVRRALSELGDLNLDLWEEDVPRIMVDPAGGVYLRARDEIVEGVGTKQMVLGDFDLVAPLHIFTGAMGPDLSRPRPGLRIVPSKLSGAPHVDSTRLETLAVAALSRRGFSLEKIQAFYPFAPRVALEEAVDLEEQLEHNLHMIAA